MDTEKDMGGAPAQTSFQLSPYLRDLWRPSLFLERGVHKPSPAEHLAPFYQDPAQRIAALTMPRSLGYLVFPVEALVGLAEGRDGCEIGWDEWKKHVAIPSIHQPDMDSVWISGCRLFSIASFYNGWEAALVMYDFSKKGRVEHLGERADPDLVGVRYLSSTGVYAPLSWGDAELIDICCSRDGVIFFVVSVLHSSLATKLNDAFHVVGQDAEDPPVNSGEKGYLYIWRF